MKYFIKILFALTLTTALFAENEIKSPSPEHINDDSLQVIDNTKPENTDENSISLQGDDSTADIPSTSNETSVAEEASEDKVPIGDIRDIRPAVDLPVEPWQIIAITCGILALLFILIFIFQKRHGQHPGISIIPPDPYHKALQELEAALQLIQRLDQRPFATGLTDAVRGYLAAVFGLPAPECTTEEVLEQLPNVTLLTEEIRENITHLLQQCDLAKFTKLQFEQPDRLKLYHQAKEFIQSTDKLIQLQNANTTEQ